MFLQVHCSILCSKFPWKCSVIFLKFFYWNLVIMRGSQEVLLPSCWKIQKGSEKFQKNFIRKRTEFTAFLCCLFFFVNICRADKQASQYHCGRSDRPNSRVYIQLWQRVARVWQIIDLRILSWALGTGVVVAWHEVRWVWRVLKHFSFLKQEANQMSDMKFVLPWSNTVFWRAGLGV